MTINPSDGAKLAVLEEIPTWLALTLGNCEVSDVSGFALSQEPQRGHAFFNFLRAVLQICLWLGLFGLLLVSGPVGADGHRSVPWYALPVGSMALLSIAAAWFSS
jgi:hypothetical protein